jgi:hypothetical protein
MALKCNSATVLKPNSAVGTTDTVTTEFIPLQCDHP